MFKIVFFWIGRIMLAGAYGWKKSSESLPAIIGATMYFVLWMLCVIFADFESEDKLFSIILSIALPLIYGLFVLIVRLKEHKRLKLETADLEKSTLSEKDSLQNANIKEDYSYQENTDKETLFSVIKDYINRKKENKKTQKTKDKKKPNILFIIISVVFIVFFIISCVFFYVQDNKINELNEKISSLNTTIKNKDSSINIANKTIDELNVELDKLKRSCADATIELFFYKYYAACVNKDSKYYHTHDCEYFDDSDFYIYNKELAEFKGYEPCQYCRWDTEGD